MQPKEEPMSFEITEEGTFNAIAFWFDLELDEETTLTTNPFAEHGEKGATWQQAVQYVEELALKPGDSLKVVAAHDTYGISFRVDDSKLEFDRGQRRTKCPLYDGTWQAHHIEFKRVTDSLARTITRSPIRLQRNVRNRSRVRQLSGRFKVRSVGRRRFLHQVYGLVFVRFVSC